MLADTTPPWDVIHYGKVENIPAGTKSVLVKYLWNAYGAGPDVCSLYGVRMEANYKLPPGPNARRERPEERGRTEGIVSSRAVEPLNVTFTWKERQADYSLIARSHTQRVEKFPLVYTIDVGGADHPVVDSLKVELASAAEPRGTTYGYSDGKDVGGEKFQDRWVIYGKNLAEGKPYACSVPSRTGWGAGDPTGKILTDGIVGPPEVGGIAYRFGALWNQGDKPVVTVDLGKTEKCGAFRIQTGGYPFWDALKGEVKDKIEVLTSVDGAAYASQGFFDFNLRWKDIPANHAWPDDETMCGPNYLLVPSKPVEARYVRFDITPARFLSISEVQVLDFVRYRAFDLKLALPDGKDRSDITQYPMKHTPSRPNIRPKANKKAG